MNKYLIEGFIALIIILVGVSLVSEVNDINNRKAVIENFDEKISNNEEVNNGEMEDIHAWYAGGGYYCGGRSNQSLIKY